METLCACLVALTLCMSIQSPSVSSMAQLLASSEHRAASLSLSRQMADVTFAVTPIALSALAFYSINHSLAATCAMIGACTTYFGLLVRKM
jgi:hypothetical protein